MCFRLVVTEMCVCVCARVCPVFFTFFFSLSICAVQSSGGGSSSVAAAAALVNPKTRFHSFPAVVNKKDHLLESFER